MRDSTKSAKGLEIDTDEKKKMSFDMFRSKDSSKLSDNHGEHCPSKLVQGVLLSTLLGKRKVNDTHDYKVSTRAKGELFGRSFVIE